LFACFKKKLVKNEMKVAQLSGYVGEHSAYHHGEASLQGAIVGMAQTYVGSNNINLLTPSGQFGTRRLGGKDHASARYIFTRLEKITRAIFHPDDDDLMTYLNDDGLNVEPEHYMPVIPMVLINGSDGIGTGWSSRIPNHDPRDVISNIRKLIDEEEPDEMHPFYVGWSGEIIPPTGKKTSYTIRGKIKRINDTTLLITELPIGKWTQEYKNFLEGMMIGSDKADDKKKKKTSKAKKDEDDEGDEKKKEAGIIDFKENHTDTTVSFTVTASKEVIDAYEATTDGLCKVFKLTTTISTTNMTAFDTDGRIKQYATSLDILREFFNQRLIFYIARKDMLLHKMRKDLSMLENKARFVEEVCRDELIVSDRKKTELLAELKQSGYDLFPKDPKEEEAADEDEEDNEDNGEEGDSTSDAELAKGYEYLLGMKIWSLTFEKAEELRRQKGEKSDEVKILEGTSPEIIWNNDLDAIEELLDERDETLGIEAKKQRHERKQMKKKGMKQKQEDEWDSEQSEIEENSSSDSEDDGSEDEDDLNLIAAKPSPKVKTTKPAASKKAPAAMKVDKSSKKRKSIGWGSPAKKSKSTKSTSKKATVKNGNASSKSKRKSSASASAPKRASKGKGGKMAISLGISPKLSVKGKKSLDKAKTADSDVDDDLVDSEDDSLPKKVQPKNNKKGLGLSRKSRKGRSTLENALQEHKESRKRQLEDDSSENNFQKKGRSDSDEGSASSDSDESEY
jgi:DNA topoisomerase II